MPGFRSAVASSLQPRPLAAIESPAEAPLTAAAIVAEMELISSATAGLTNFLKDDVMGAP